MGKMDLKTFLAKAQDWDTVPTSIRGAYIQKMPGSKRTEPHLAVNVNPVGSNGQPTKRRGYTIRQTAETTALREVLGHEKFDKLVDMVVKLNGGLPVTAIGEDVLIEI